MPELTELQKTITAYQHFTLEQWQAMARAMAVAPGMTEFEKLAILQKFPSAAL